MTLRPILAMLVALALATPTLAQTPATPTSPTAGAAQTQTAAAAPSTAFAVPQNTCVAPAYPSKEKTEHLKGDAYNRAVEAFNRDYKAYGECIKKYVDDTKQMLKALADAGNKAIEDYNKYTADLKEQIQADTK